MNVSHMECWPTLDQHWQTLPHGAITNVRHLLLLAEMPLASGIVQLLCDLIALFPNFTSNLESNHFSK